MDGLGAFGGGLVVGKMMVRLVADASQMMKEMDKAERRAAQWKTAIAGAFSALGAAASAYIAHATLTAARTEVLGTSLETVGKTAGYSVAELRRYEEAVKSMGITTQEARLALIRFIQSELDLADAAKLARAAQDLAVIAGQNSSEAFAQITQAINAQRPVLLRQYGIVKGLEEIYKDMGRQLGIYTERVNSAGEVEGSWARQLTQKEKKLAFLNVVLEEAAKVSGVYANAMEDAGKKLTSLPRVFEEARNVIGEQFLPAFARAVDLLYQAVKWFGNADPALQKTAATFLGLAAAIGTVGGAAILVGPSIMAMSSAIASVAAPVAAAMAAMGALSAAWNYNVLNIQGRTRDLSRSLRSLGEYAQREFGPGIRSMISEWAETMRVAREVIGRHLEAIGIDTRALGNVWAFVVDAMELAWYSLIDTVGDGVRAIIAGFEAIGEAARGDLDAARQTLVDAWREVNETTAETTRAAVEGITEQIRVTEELAAQDRKLVGLVRAWEGVARGVESATEEAATAALDLSAVWESVAEAMRNTGDENEQYVRDTFERIADQYATHAENIVQLEAQRTEALEALQREYLDLREKLQRAGDERGLRELEIANKRKREAIIRYYKLRIEDERRSQEALLETARAYLTVAKAQLQSALADQIAATKMSAETILSITRNAWGGVTTISRAAQEAMRGAFDAAKLQEMMSEIDRQFAAIEERAKQAADRAAQKFDAWREANDGLRDSLEEIGIDLDGIGRKTKERLRDPLEEAARTTDRIASMIARVRDTLEDLAAFGGPRGDWLTPMRDVMGAAIEMVNEWAERVDELVRTRGDILVGDGRKTFSGILASVRDAAGALASTVSALQKMETFDNTVPLGVLDAVADWGRRFVEVFSEMEDFADVTSDRRVASVMDGTKTAAGTVGAIAGTVDKLAGLNVSWGAASIALTNAVEFSRELVTSITKLAGEMSTIPTRAVIFADRVRALAAPIGAVADVVDKLAAMRYRRGTDLGDMVEWGAELLAQVSVWLSRMYERIPEDRRPTAALARLTVTLGEIIAPLGAVADVVDAFATMRYRRGTDLGDVIKWGAELLAQVAVWVGRMREWLPEAYVPTPELERFTASLSGLVAPFERVADVVSALADVRNLRGTDLGAAVGWGAEVLAQVAVWMGRLRGRLPEAYVPTPDAERFANSMAVLTEPIARAGELASYLDGARALVGTRLGDLVAWGAEVLAQVAVWMGRLRARLPEAYMPTPDVERFSESLGALVQPIAAVVSLARDLDQSRGMVGTRMGDMIEWVVELVAQIMVRVRRLATLRAGDVALAVSAIQSVAPAVDALAGVASLVGSLRDVAGLRGRIDAGAQVEYLIGLIEEVGQRIAGIPGTIRSELLRFQDEAGAVVDVFASLGAAADALSKAAGIREMARARAIIGAILDTWDNMLQTLSARLTSGELTVSPLVQKWSEAVGSLAAGLGAGIEVLRDARLLGDVRALLPVADDIGKAIIEFANELANNVTGFDVAIEDAVSAWGAAVRDLMNGLGAGLSLIREMPRQWEDPGDVWDAFQEWVKGAFREFYNWVNDEDNAFTYGGMDLTAAFSGALAELMRGLRDALEVATSLPARWDVPSGVWDAFRAWVKETFQDFEAWARNISADPAYFEPVEAFGTAMAAVFTGLGGALDVFTGLVGFIPPTEERVNAFTDRVKAVFSDMRAEAERIGADGIDMTAQFGNALQAITGGLSSALDLFTALMDRDVLAFIGTGNQKDGPFAKALSDLIQGISITMEAFKTWVLDRYADSWGPAADLFHNKVDAVLQTMRDALSLFTNLQNQGLPSTSLIQQFIDQTIALFQAFANEMAGTDQDIDGEREQIVNALDRAVADVRGRTGAFADAGAEVAGALVTALVNTANMRWRGRMLMEGLESGLSEGRGDVVRAMRLTAEAMREELERAWGIASPSRVAKRIGMQINAGLVEGMGDAYGIMRGGSVDVSARKVIDVNVNVKGDNLTAEQRWELARELAYLIRAGA